MNRIENLKYMQCMHLAQFLFSFWTIIMSIGRNINGRYVVLLHRQVALVFSTSVNRLVSTFD